MDLDSAVTNLSTLLQGDTALSGWRTTHFAGKDFTVLKGNRALNALQPSQVPALILDMEPMEVEQRVGNYASDVNGAIACAVVWQENQPDTAYAQRIGLPEMIVKAVMGDPKLGGAARSVRVSNVQPLDGDSSAPNVRTVRFSVEAKFTVERA